MTKAAPWDGTKLARLERRLGKPLPTGLVQLLLYCGDHFQTGWELVPNHTPEDQSDVAFRPKPPEQFLDWSHGVAPGGEIQEFNQRQMTLTNAEFPFRVGDLEDLQQVPAGWVEQFGVGPLTPGDIADTLKILEGMETDLLGDYLDQAKAQLQNLADGTTILPPPTDEDTAREAEIAAFMQRGFPFATAPNGDWLELEDKHILHISHEGDVAGVIIDLPLPEFLLHQAMLGFPGLDYMDIDLFCDPVAGVDDEALILAAPFRATSAVGLAWRDWFWAGVKLPQVPEHLLEPME